MKTDLENNSNFYLPWLMFLSIILSISLILPTGFGDFIKDNISIISCPYKQLMGHGCPLCGMTRAFVNAAHGNFSYSFYFNPAGFLLFIYMVAYIGAGWIFFFSRNKLLEKFIRFNALIPILLVTMGSWVIILIFK